MRLTNFFLYIIFHLLPANILDVLLNRALPNTYGAFKRFSNIDPSLLEYYSGKKVLFMFRRAARLIPAYKKFLEQRGIDPAKIKNTKHFDELVPATTKENYVKAFPLNERCLHGRLPDRGYIEESAGTSGKSTFWIRSREEELNNLLLMKATMMHLYGSDCGGRPVIINAMAQGGWSGGLRFASRVGSLGIVKNTGPDPARIIRCLKELGNEFTYLLGGYPPFIVELIEYGNKTENFSWKDYHINLFPAGEGFVEEWRDYVLSQLREETLVFSDYGAIDLDVGISVETPFSVAIRKLMQEDIDLRRALLSADRLPCFVGQASNQHFYIREAVNKEGNKELEITVMNLKSVSPNIKYAIGDEGGIVSISNVFKSLDDNGYRIEKLCVKYNISSIVPFPLLYIYGRNDGTVTINGALISPSEINEAVLSDRELTASLNTFRLSVESDADNFIKLFIYLELRENVALSDYLAAKCNERITAHLLESNECFRNSFRKNPEIFKPVIKILPYHTGLFENDDSSIKRVYIRQNGT